MDLFNNDVGRKLYESWAAAKAAGFMDLSLEKYIYDAVKAGETINSISDPMETRKWIESPSSWFKDIVSPEQNKQGVRQPVMGWVYIGNDNDPDDPDEGAEGELLYRLIPPSDPLILDLNGNGIETLALNASSPILFDHNSSGIKQATGWVAPSDGFLVLDRNGNGQIDNGGELFGNSTVRYDGNGEVAGNATDGFAALSQQDTNGDGIVDANDANFADLRIWQDLNQDGTSQANELTALADAGIVSLSIGKVSSGAMLLNGNSVGATGSYTRTNGETGEMADINLALNPLIHGFSDSIPISADAVALPNMSGSGGARDLREAASMQTAQGATLLTALRTFAASESGLAQHAMMDDIMHAWTDTSTLETSAQQAFRQGLTIHYLDATGVEVSADAAAHLDQIISTLEVFGGVKLAGQWGIPSAGVADVDVSLTGQLDAAFLETRYHTIKETVFGAIAFQSRLIAYLQAISIDISPDAATFLDFTYFNALISEQRAADPQGALIDLIDLYKYANTPLSAMGWNGQKEILTSVNALRGTPELDAVIELFNFSNPIGWSTGDNPDVIFAQNLGWTFGNGGDDVIIGSDARDQLDGGTGNDAISGGTGGDLLWGGDGDDVLLGDQGNDGLRGDAGNDHITGGGGDDILEGGVGSDVYHFNIGDGHDTVFAEFKDTIRFGVGILPGQITVTRDYANLFIAYNNGQDKITIAGWFYSPANKIARVEFADEPTVIDVAALENMITVAPATENDDVLIGTVKDDTIDGLADNDDLDGGLGNDTYLFGPGGGRDRVNENDGTSNNVDIVKFAVGVAPSDVVVAESYGGLSLSIKGTDDTLTIDGWFRAYPVSSQRHQATGIFWPKVGATPPSITQKRLMTTRLAPFRSRCEAAT